MKTFYNEAERHIYSIFKINRQNFICSSCFIYDHKYETMIFCTDQELDSCNNYDDIDKNLINWESWYEEIHSIMPTIDEHKARVKDFIKIYYLEKRDNQ